MTTEKNQRQSKTLYNKYESLFPEDYTQEYPFNVIVNDIKKIELLSVDNPIEIDLHFPEKQGDSRLNLKLFQYQHRIPLSDILPMLEKSAARHKRWPTNKSLRRKLKSRK